MQFKKGLTPVKYANHRLGWAKLMELVIKIRQGRGKRCSVVVLPKLGAGVSIERVLGMGFVFSISRSEFIRYMLSINYLS
jgi:hypothetical protein